MEGGTSASGGQSVPKTLRGRQSSGSIASRSTCRITSLDSHLFRVLLLRRLQLSLPQTVRTCWCGRSLDVHGHHRAPCARAGVLGRRGHAVEGVAATNIFVRDLDLELHNAGDTRKRWRMGCLCSEEPNWLWIPPWSVLFGEMGRREQEQREGMALRWQPQDEQKSGVTQNWWCDARGRGWLCWLWRWGDDGRQKHRPPSKSGDGMAVSLGGLCWRAQWRGHWPHRFWSVRRHQGRTVRHLRSMRSSEIWLVL